MGGAVGAGRLHPSPPHTQEGVALTGKGEEGLAPHAPTQQAELDLWAALLLEPGKQGHQILHRHTWAEVLQVQHLTQPQKESQSVGRHGWLLVSGAGASLQPSARLRVPKWPLRYYKRVHFPMKRGKQLWRDLLGWGDPPSTPTCDDIDFNLFHLKAHHLFCDH